MPLAEIVAIVRADDYVELRRTNGRKLLHAARLDRLEADLPASFLRVHRSVTANPAHVRGFERNGGQARLLMDDNAPLPISRNRLSTVGEAREAVELRTRPRPQPTKSRKRAGPPQIGQTTPNIRARIRQNCVLHNLNGGWESIGTPV